MNLAKILALSCVLTLLAGCGASGGGDPVLVGVAQRTSVALMLSGDSSDGFSANGVNGVHVTYSKVSLVPADGSEPVVLFESTEGEEVNISALDEEALLFAVMDDVPEGKYTKILVAMDDVRVEGGPCEDLETKVPDDELELVPDEAIEIKPGDTIIIRLAMDSDKSVQIAVDGATDTCIFRPVVGVEVSKAAAAVADSCPTTVDGSVARLLLNLQLDTIGAVLDLGDGAGEQELLFNEETAFFNNAGLPADVDVVAIGEDLTAKGELDSDGALVTRVAITGETAVVMGEITHDAALHDGLGIFVMLPDEGSAVTGSTPVELFDGTQILLDCVEATPEVIVKGAKVIVTGKLAVGERSMRAASVLVSATVLCGELTEIATTTGGWTITMIPEGTQGFRSVSVPAKVGFHLEGDGPIPADMLTDLVNCAGRFAKVHLAEDAKDDVATEVRVEAEDFRDTVERIAPDERLLVLGESVVEVRRGATILDLRHGQAPASLEDIEPGDLVRAFGLDACPDEKVDFHAFVLLILPHEDRPLPPDPSDTGCHYNKWKQNLDRWPDRFPPDRLFVDVFHNDVFGRMTLFQVIDQKGGKLNHLGRETVAALLSAASDEIRFDLTVDEVIRKFNSIDLDDEKGEVKDLQKDFHDLTKGECPLDDDDDDGDDDGDDDDDDDRDDD
ncbi:MAG: DUF4382 domain-containing protein [Planctomycetota bacterium]|jgi:hypothetical protein